MTALIDRSSFSVCLTGGDHESSKSSEEDFDLSENFDNEAKIGNDYENDKIEEDWQLNILVRFNINPTSVIKFGEDLRSKRSIVTWAADGLQLLKGLPILEVDGQDVSNLDGLLLEEMLSAGAPAWVLKFGNKPFEVERSNDFERNIRFFEDRISFLGETSSVAFENIDTNMKGRWINDLELVQEEQSKDLSDDDSIDMHYDQQPISLEGTLGDMANWSKKCKERAKIITELLNTEKSYIKGLEKLNIEFLKLYVEPLKESIHIDLAPFQTKVWSLIFLHDKIYEKLCSAENICTVFQREFKFLKMYKAYVKDYEEASNKLKEGAKKRKRAFKSLFQNASERVSQDPMGFFQGLGITIVQRPPRYILLLRQLIKNTPIGHPMYGDLEKALSEIEATCGDINDYQGQNEFEFIKVSKNIDHKTLTEWGVTQLVVPSRRLVRVGNVGIKSAKSSKISFMRRGSSEGLNLWMGRIVMCNDILIIMSGRKNYVKRVFMLAEIEALVKTEPTKTSRKNTELEWVYEVVLKKRSADVMLKLHTNREKRRATFTKHGRNSTLGLDRLSKACFQTMVNEENFSIYLSTLKEAEVWNESIMKYSSKLHTVD